MFVLKETKGQHEENCKLYVLKKYGLFHGRTIITQMESLHHTENPHHYQHPFSQYSAYSLSRMSAIPSFPIV